MIRPILGAALAALALAAGPAAAQTAGAAAVTPSTGSPAAAPGAEPAPAPPAPIGIGRQPVLLLGGGNVTGLAFASAGAIARVIDDAAAATGFRTAVLSTGGSMENLVRLGEGELDLGIVGSDWLYDAQLGFGPFEGRPKRDDLRTLFALYPEALTILARADAGIATVADLAGKRLNLGPRDNPARPLFEQLLDAAGIEPEMLASIAEVTPADQGAVLCAGELDAVAYLAGHPNGTIRAVLAGCGAVIVPVTGAPAEKLLADSPYLAAATIPGGLYPGLETPVETIGPMVVVAATTALDAEHGYIAVKALFENLAALRVQLPVLADLDPRAMARDGLTAPLHDGAARYADEAGLR